MIRFNAALTVFALVQIAPAIKISYERLQAIANKVNSNNTSSWRARDYFNNLGDFLDTAFKTGVVRSRDCESDPKPKNWNSTSKTIDECRNDSLPIAFDARDRWNECHSTLNHVYDQGHCGACWVFSVLSSFVDRLCIKSKGEKKALRSAEQLLSCVEGDGCKGGWPLHAWKYIVKTGSVTGGDYNSKKGCQPYRIKPYSHYAKNSNLEMCSHRKLGKPVKCEPQCYNEGYEKSFSEDIVKAKSAYSIKGVCKAQEEIFTKGPIIAIFEVYEDFHTYKSGVYQPMTGKKTGYHAVRVLGWGVEKGLPYWLCVNSWSRSWGNHGTFKFIRGSNVLEFEKYFSAGEA